MVVNILRKLHNVFPSGYTNLHSHQQCMRVPFPPQPLQHLLVLLLFMIDILTDVRWYRNVILICISLIACELEHFFMPVGCLYAFLGEMSVQVLCPFFNWIVLLLLLSCMKSLYILEISFLLVELFANIFSHSVDIS